MFPDLSFLQMRKFSGYANNLFYWKQRQGIRRCIDLYLNDITYSPKDLEDAVIEQIRVVDGVLGEGWLASAD